MKYQPTIFVDNELCTKLQNGEVTLPVGSGYNSLGATSPLDGSA